jgi:hypothetical protein
MRFLLPVALAAMLMNGAPAAAEIVAGSLTDATTANYVLPGCRSYAGWIPGERFTQESVMRAGVCFGYLQAIADLGTSSGSICSTPNIPMTQVAAIVVHYLDLRPSRWNERFTSLALEALISAWPCGPSAAAKK